MKKLDTLVQDIYDKLDTLTEGKSLNVSEETADAFGEAMKKALVLLDMNAKEEGLDYKFVANIHDEWQVEVKNEHAEDFGMLAVQSIKDAGFYFNMDCPLDGEYKIGEDWSETH